MTASTARNTAESPRPRPNKILTGLAATGVTQLRARVGPEKMQKALPRRPVASFTNGHFGPNIGFGVGVASMGKAFQMAWAAVWITRNPQMEWVLLEFRQLDFGETPA